MFRGWSGMKTTAVVFERPGEVTLQSIDLPLLGDGDALVEILASGISSGTERLLYTGTMPKFPGMGYPLVPGYESVGVIADIKCDSGNLQRGDTVFVPGAQCYGVIRGLFGGASSHVIVATKRLKKIDPALGVDGTLLALAATAYRAVAACGETGPDLIVGHGAVGRLIARITCALGHEPPVVWENQPQRKDGATGYQVLSSNEDERKNYTSICDASGDSLLLDDLISRLQKGGQITLAGFYHQNISFEFAPAFMREARLRIAAEWTKQDLDSVVSLLSLGKLSLSGLVTNEMRPDDVKQAYETAFNEASCLKLVLDWRPLQ